MDPSSSDSAPDGWRLLRRPHGRLDFVAADGTVHADGAELAWIDTLATLPEAFRARLLGELSAREFLPVIERIEAIADSDPAEWTVATDRGPRRFAVASPEDVERLPDGSAFVVDTAGVRYRIPDTGALDAHSRRLLDRTME